jgi:hypothetical protein
MKRIFAFLFLASAIACFAQTDNTIYVKQFPGVTVGQKVAAAMLACNPNTAIPCIVVIDPSLAAWATGTMPAPCSRCSVLDYRTGPPFASTVVYPVPGTGTISAALAANPNNTRLVLGCGTYTDNVNITGTFVQVQGSGACTQLRQQNTSLPMIAIGPPNGTTGQYYIYVTDLAMVATASTADGIQFNSVETNGSAFDKIARVYIQGFQNGIDITGQTIWLTIEDANLVSNVQDGLKVSSSYPVNYLNVERLISFTNGYYGAYLNAAGTSYTINFDQPDIEGNGASILTSNCAAMYFTGLIVGLSVNKGHFESACTGGDANASVLRLTGSGIYGVELQNNYFSSASCGVFSDATVASGNFNGNAFFTFTSSCGYDYKIVNSDTTSGASGLIVGPDTYFNDGQPYWSFTGTGPVSLVAVNNGQTEPPINGVPVGAMNFPYGIETTALFVGNGTNVVYRCLTAGTLAAGALTITAADCGTSTDTGLRTK